MSRTPPIWSSLTPEEHEYHYNPQHTFPDFGQSREYREPFNEAVRRDFDKHLDIAYGKHPLHTLDIYPAQVRNDGAPTPVHVFYHGGYWRAQDKSNFAFIAGTLVPRGITTVVMNYELCPDSTLDGVVDSAVAGFNWLLRHINEYGGDVSRISLSGHSAGAHLGAAIIARGNELANTHCLQGALLSCGLYDPAPAQLTTVNAELQLNKALIERHNYEVKPPVLRPQITLMAGAREPWQWIDQTFRYYHWLRQHDLQPCVDIVHGRDHFDILNEFLISDSATVKTVLRHSGVDPVS